MKSRQAGFTLIEIAIVLVIIGLLLGGVLKGQELVNSAKVKSLGNEIKALQTMIYAYQDKFRAIPGDDAKADVNVGGTLSSTAGKVGDGRLDSGTWVGATAPDAAKETSLFWEHVRRAGLASGDVGSGQATNAVGGKLGITGVGDTARVTTPTGVAGTYVVCSSGIEGKLARQLDYSMDDGDGTKGSMFAAVETAGAIEATTTAAAYDDTKTFTVCMTF